MKSLKVLNVHFMHKRADKDEALKHGSNASSVDGSQALRVWKKAHPNGIRKTLSAKEAKVLPF